MPKQAELMIALTSLNATVLKKIDPFLSPHGISYSEFLVLFHLNRAHPLSMRRIDLAEKVGLSASGVTRLLNPMERNRLVQKDLNARDARVSLIKLTHTGKRVYNESYISFGEGAESILSPLNESQQTRLNELVAALSG